MVGAQAPASSSSRKLKLPQVGRSVLAMASSSASLSNPWGKTTENKKARTGYGAQSPFTPLLQEEKEKEYARMEEEEQEEEELVPTCPPPMDSPSAKVPTEAVTMDGIATLLQQQLGPITANITLTLTLNLHACRQPIWAQVRQVKPTAKYNTDNYGVSLTTIKHAEIIHQSTPQIRITSQNLPIAQMTNDNECTK